MKIVQKEKPELPNFTTVSGKKKRGRPSTKTPKFPLQAEKMRYLFSKLGDMSNEEFGKRIGGISRGPVSSWRSGQGLLEDWAKKLIAHEFNIAEEYWDAPEDARIEEYLGKRQPTPSRRDEEIRALILSLQEKAEVFERETAALSQLTGR